MEEKVFNRRNREGKEKRKIKVQERSEKLLRGRGTDNSSLILVR